MRLPIFFETAYEPSEFADLFSVAGVLVDEVEFNLQSNIWNVSGIYYHKRDEPIPAPRANEPDAEEMPEGQLNHKEFSMKHISKKAALSCAVALLPFGATAQEDIPPWMLEPEPGIDSPESEPRRSFNEDDSEDDDLPPWLQSERENSRRSGQPSASSNRPYHHLVKTYLSMDMMK